jgi:lycopene cyclase domain-containing protein
VAGSFSYLLWTALFGALPTLLLVVLFPGPVRRHRRAIALVTLIVGTLSVAWDAAAVALGLWRFAPERVVGVGLLGSPIETLVLGVTVAAGVASLTAVLHERLD